MFIALVAASTLASVAPAASAQEFVTSPPWIRKPTLGDVFHFIPARAIRDGLSGQAVIECTVTAMGDLENCRATSESPAGVGFGDAAAKMGRFFKMKPTLPDGRPVAGGRVRIPVTFMSPTRGGLVVNVAWLAAPSIADVAAAFPEKAKARAEVGSGAAALTCRVTASGSMGGCQIVAESPRGLGFGAAALRLAQTFRAPLATADGQSLTGRLTSLNFNFVPQISGSGVMGKVAWAALPSSEQFTSAFPEAANKAGVTAARIVLACTVGPDGAMADCRAESEDPPKLGFAAAAIAIAPSFRARLWTDEGLPVIGGKVRLPIRFQINDAQAAPSGGPP